MAAARWFIMTVIGILLVLKSEPPPSLEKHLMSWF